MRIVIVAHGLRSGGGISVGQNIIAALGRLAPHHHYLITIPADLDYEHVCHNLPQHELSIFPHGGDLARRYFYEIQQLPKLVEQFNADAALCLGNVALQGVKIPQVLLLQNAYYVYPSSHFGRSASIKERLLVAIQRSQFSRDLRRIRLLICQTETMANRVYETYNYQGPIRVFSNAVSRYTLDGAEHDRPSLPDPLTCVANKHLLFYLTAYYSHKNLETIVNLFDKKRDALRDYAVVLTIDSNQGDGAKKLLESVRQLGLEDSIINVGPLPQQALSSYFFHCHALFMPTLLESFSSTYLEAFHFGLPILTSDMDFAHTVCGDAAIYFDPWNMNSMIKAILSINEQSGGLVVRGRERLSSLYCDWDEVGVGFLDAVESVA